MLAGTGQAKAILHALSINFEDAVTASENLEEEVTELACVDYAAVAPSCGHATAPRMAASHTASTAQ